MPEKKEQEKQLFPEYVNVLGVPWKIVIKKFEDDPYFDKHSANGYCSTPDREVCICENRTWPGEQDESESFHINVMKQTLRHELTHAFLYESGLYDSGHRTNCWSRDEEIVDWIAIQGQKLYRLWQEAKCLDTPINPEEWIKMKTATASVA